MATVTLDCSEYDMLREDNRKKDKEIEKLNKEKEAEVNRLSNEIKGLEDKSRVVIKTRDVGYNIDINKVVKDIKSGFKVSSKDLDIIRNSWSNDEASLKEDYILYILEHASNGYTTLRESIQYSNFEDVRQQVEDRYKQELEDAYNHKKETYEKALDNLDEKYLKQHNEEVLKLETKISELTTQSMKDIKEFTEKKDKDIQQIRENYQGQIDELNKEIAELKKTKEEKIAEATAKLEEAQRALEKLTGKKKWYQQIFK